MVETKIFLIYTRTSNRVFQYRSLLRHYGYVSQFMTTHAQSLVLLLSGQRTILQNPQKILTDWFMEGNVDFSVLKWSPRSRDFSIPYNAFGMRRKGRIETGCTGRQSGFTIYNENRMNTHFKRLLPEYCRIHAERNCWINFMNKNILHTVIKSVPKLIILIMTDIITRSSQYMLSRYIYKMPWTCYQYYFLKVILNLHTKIWFTTN